MGSGVHEQHRRGWMVMDSYGWSWMGMDGHGWVWMSMSRVGMSEDR